jgi:amidohydrolase
MAAGRPLPPLAQQVLATLDDVDVAGRLAEVARDLHAHPELAYQETYAAERLATELERAGLTVERGAGGVATALRASFGHGPGRIAILAEYDALPGIGHACGHNLIASGALGATLALARLADQLPGEVVFLGTPAEEGGGGKIRLLDAGLFAGLDAAIMYHPFDRTLLRHPSLAMCRVEIVFHGRPSHAAGAPWDGASALRGVIQTFNLIDSARVHLRDGARIHGIITDGGKAVNIIPERAACAFSVRAPTAAYLGTVLATVTRCAEAAAAATDTRVEIIPGMGYKDMRNNEPLYRRFGEHLTTLGVRFRDDDDRVGAGSTDMGDVSHVVPSIHPYVAVCGEGESFPHQVDFTRHAGSQRGIDAARDAAKAMALTALDVISDPELRAEARRAFDER